MTFQIFPATKKQVRIIHLHTNNRNDALEIAEWLNPYKNDLQSYCKEIPYIFGINYELQNWPALDSDKEYVWVIESPSDNFQFDYENLFNKKTNFICIIVWGVNSVKRINKILVPFL